MRKIRIALTGLLMCVSMIVTAGESCINISKSGHGGDVILIPGFLSDGSVWKETQSLLEQNHTVHLVQIAGFGDTPACDNSTNVITSAKSELESYIASQKLSNVSIVGHSLGGFLSYWLAIDNPQIKRVVSVDGLPFIGPIFTRNANTSVKDMAPQVEFLTSMYQSADSTRMASITQSGINIQTRSNENKQRIINMAAKSDGVTAASAIKTLLTTDLREKLAHTNAEILFIGAVGGFSNKNDIDSITNLYKSQFKHASNASLDINKNALHFIMWDDFTGFAHTLTRFLKEG